MQMIDLSGTWHSTYRYPSSGRGGDFWSNHTLEATQKDTTVELKSDSGGLSHVSMSLACDFSAGTATGAWHEQTNPEGYYEGREYEGTVTFVIAPDGQRLDGTWQGEGKDGTTNSDVWYLSREPFTDAHQVERTNSDG